MTPTKPFWRSKTVWFNVLTILVIIAGRLGFTEFKMDTDTEAGLITIVNLVLRFVTKSPVR